MVRLRFVNLALVVALLAPTVASGTDEPTPDSRPPVSWRLGGQVVHGDRTHLVAWSPANDPMPDDYRGALRGFLADVAADSGSNANVYAVVSEYGDARGNGNYKSTFAGEVVDQSSLPGDDGCHAPPPALGCVTVAAIQRRLEAVIMARHLPTSAHDIYFFMLPPGVTGCMGGTQCDSTVCGYHSEIDRSDGSIVLYAALSYLRDARCNEDILGRQPEFDTTLSVLSHEHIETLTDPYVDAWMDRGKLEIADMCIYRYGAGAQDPDGSWFNQVINGHHYWLQEEWSNYAHACVAQPPAAPRLTVALKRSRRKISFRLDGAPVGWRVRWRFGDGSTGIGLSSAHSYSGRRRRYNVAVTATGHDGSVLSAQRSVAG